MNAIVPRFEFRTFAPDLSRFVERLQRLSHDGVVDESREVYILRAGEWHRNIKIRRGKLELKELIGQNDALQRWRPAGVWAFPVGASELQETILPGLRSDDLPRGTQFISKRCLLDELVRDNRELLRANVSKRRTKFSIGACATEFDDILVNGALIRSVAIESEDAAAVIATSEQLGLAGCENISYPLAIARIMGFEPLPDEGSYG